MLGGHGASVKQPRVGGAAAIALMLILCGTAYANNEKNAVDRAAWLRAQGGAGTNGSGRFDSSGNLLVNCATGCSGGSGGGGTSSNFGSAFPAAGTAAGFIDASGNMAGANLDSGGRLITTGAGGTFPVTGTFFQTTQPVSLTSTTITGTVAVTGTFFQATQPVSCANGATCPVNATLSAETTKVIGTVNQGTSPWVTSCTAANCLFNLTQVASTALGTPAAYGSTPTGNAVSVNSFITNTVATTLASTTITGTVAVTQSTSPWVVSCTAANCAINNAQVNGVTVLTGTGATGTGAQRVTVATDSATVAGSATLPAGTNVIGHVITDTNSTTAVTGTVTTQTTGNTAVLSGQQAVTGSAVVLTTNAAKTVCIHALAANAINVYIGPTGITTSTGMELPPGTTYCAPASNTNLFFVIASTTGASVSWITSN